MARTSRRALSTILLLASVSGAPGAYGQVATTTGASDEGAGDLAARMGDEALRQEDREEAARRLVTWGTSQAREALRTALEAGNRNAQLAAARGLATDRHPDPGLVPVLFRLIGPDRALTEAAVRALGAYRGNADVVTRLGNLAAGRNERDATRLAAIGALGLMADKTAAQSLVSVATRADEPVGIVSAAAAALGEMTGLRENGVDVARWRQWWAENENRSDEDFRSAVLESQAARFARMALRQHQLEEEIGSLLSDQYQLSPDRQKPEMLLRFLRSGEGAVRVVGARLFFDDAVNNRPIAPAAVARLREMVGDSSAEVRLAAAEGLRAVNDAQAVTPLLLQLARETDEPVRAAIARALAASHDVSVLDALRKLLREPSPTLVQSAAEAIRELAPAVREKDAALARATAEELRDVLEQRASHGDGAAGQDLRESLVMAMAALREPSMLKTYYGLLRAKDSSGALRRAAVKAIGELREPQAADAIVDLLDDPDATVRLEAIEAIGKAGSFQSAETLYRRLSPSVEPDPSVRERAWAVMEKLLATAPSEQLAQWAQRFSREPERRLVVLKLMADREQHDAQAEPLAYTRKAIGDTLMSLGRPAEAVPYFRQSLEYWGVREPRGMTAVGLNQQLLNALLRSKQYAPATAFGGQLLAADISNQQTVGPAIRGEARRLIDANDLADARTLITEARRMSPGLDARYLQALGEMEAEIQTKGSAGPRSAGVMRSADRGAG